MTNPRCSCGAPLVCFSELAGRDELLAMAKDSVPLLLLGGYYITADKLQTAIKLAESRHPVEVAK